jgi:hypothetical protein
MRLNNQTQLSQGNEQAQPAQKTAAVRNAPNTVVLSCNGAFNLQGGCGLEKLSRDYRYELDPVTTEFMLGLLGVDGNLAKTKMAKARKKGMVKLSGLKTIYTLAERYQESEKTAAEVMREMPALRRDLIKEAAALEDENTVDKVLALNFINPENLSTFVEYLPELEHTSEQLAEMLLYSYMGLKDVPEEAVERCMTHLEEVSAGLKAIQHAEAA